MNILRKLVNRFEYLRFKYFGDKVIPMSQYPFVSPNGIIATHISACNHYNAGDTFLPVILRNLFNDSIGIKKWIDKPVQKKVKPSDISIYNSSDIVIIGGGGLFLKDTHPNNTSGWQWNCSIDMLDKIETPLVAFAIGYNRFRNQEDFEPIFTEHLNRFVEKAKFIGIRNHGSITKLKNYLYTQELKDKLTFQPCMTTLTSILYPKLFQYSKKENFIALNCAFDRQDMRKADDKVLTSIAKVISQLSETTKIKVYAHMTSDGKICSHLDKLSVPYEYVEFKDTTNMLSAYSRPRLVIGMRGHAQMIPFGCNTPILSIISHDKMQWFLDDIHHPEWGVDVLNPSFETELFEKAKELYNSTEKLIPILKEEQQLLWNITQQNMNFIKSIIKNK
ncbi:polysaccharide pyruvyl transferase family protein [Phocaeicola sp. Sa1CVN1]|uniref:Polysaccharide pyruvyl transferase family protein n=1 Tax=Phocaeicola intestinalis TaxID=2762212 RepID=A0ABR8YBP6_9BACT|nr:polysaccharide pyruvyl transferase family protein [Phocaeicola intestinalis]MBD8041640.1 polysaccharide pyruvyl transferase family protein [Phocaeicola intestinalis]